MFHLDIELSFEEIICAKYCVLPIDGIFVVAMLCFFKYYALIDYFKQKTSTAIDTLHRLQVLCLGAEFLTNNRTVSFGFIFIITYIM